MLKYSLAKKFKRVHIVNRSKNIFYTFENPMNTVFLLLGGNKGNVLNTFELVLYTLKKEIGTIEKKSSIYITKAWGNTEQADFLNQALKINTLFDCDQILKKILTIEELYGRKRTNEKWSERTIDIDILLFNNEIINQSDLTVPHPYLHKRKFTLAPLSEIADNVVHPILKKNIISLMHECEDVLEVKKHLPLEKKIKL